MAELTTRVKNRRWWGCLFLLLGISSATYSFVHIRDEVDKRHLLDAPIAGTVHGKYRLRGAAVRADGTDEILESRLNSSNVVYYLLQQKQRKDGKWISLPETTDSVPYLLRDNSGDITVRNAEIVDAFSREVERGDFRQRQAMLMVNEPAIGVGTVHVDSEGKRVFDGRITPERFYKDGTNILVRLARYFVYINIFFFVIAIAADYRSSRYGRGLQTIVCVVATIIVALCYELCLFREGHEHLLDNYQTVHSNLLVAEDQIDRAQWILGVDAYNEHAKQLIEHASSFPASFSVKLFDLEVPELIDR